MCVSKCMLTKCVLRKSERGREAEEEEAEHGIQNQKQEPHTNLWGKKTISKSIQFLYIAQFKNCQKLDFEASP